MFRVCGVNGGVEGPWSAELVFSFTETSINVSSNTKQRLLMDPRAERYALRLTRAIEDKNKQAILVLFQLDALTCRKLCKIYQNVVWNWSRNC